jgi:hypothetical protein
MTLIGSPPGRIFVDCDLEVSDVDTNDFMTQDKKCSATGSEEFRSSDDRCDASADRKLINYSIVLRTVLTAKRQVSIGILEATRELNGCSAYRQLLDLFGSFGYFAEREIAASPSC